MACAAAVRLEEESVVARALRRSHTLRLLPILAGALLLFTRLTCPLLEPEETRYAEIPRQMLAEGHLFTPVWHGAPYWHKPPLLYWLVMASYQVFGVHDWSARLVPCLAAFATVLVIYGWAWRTAGPAAGFCSALVLALSARFIYQGRMIGMDGLLALWVTAGLAAGHLAVQGAALRKSWWALSALAGGLGLLTKGPVALALISVPLFVWSRFASATRPGLRGWLMFVAIAAGVAAPWYVALAFTDPEAAGAFFWLHNVQRFVTPFDHAEPVWYFVPLLFLGTLPWSALAVPLARTLWCQLRTREKNRVPKPTAGMPWDPAAPPTDCHPRAWGGNFFLLSFAWCLVFFSLSGCKRNGYLLTMMPLWAAVLGTFLARYFSDVSPARLRLAGASAALLFLVLLIAVLEQLPGYHRRFALRGQVRRHSEASAGIPVVCYPRRWDSISFYLARADVRVFASAEREQLLAELARHERVLAFIKNRGYLPGFLQALPPSLEFVPDERQGPNVTSGFVRRRAAIPEESACTSGAARDTGRVSSGR